MLTAFAQPQQADSQDMAVGSTALTAQDAVSYIERSWEENAVVEETESCGSYTPVENSSEAVEWSGNINGGWYVVSGDVTISNRITVDGEVNLILCDGTTLTAIEGVTVTKGNALNIYPGNTGNNVVGTGKLYAGCQVDEEELTVSCAADSAGIGGKRLDNGNSNDGDSGTVNIHGGNVTAIGSSEAAGIGSSYQGDNGTVTIYGGTVEATGRSGGAGIGSGDSDADGWHYKAGLITIYGGTVEATGGSQAAGIGGGRNGFGGGWNVNDDGGVAIHGGDVTATGVNGGASAAAVIP